MGQRFHGASHRVSRTAAKIFHRIVHESAGVALLKAMAGFPFTVNDYRRHHFPPGPRRCAPTTWKGMHDSLLTGGMGLLKGFPEPFHHTTAQPHTCR